MLRLDNLSRRGLIFFCMKANKWFLLFLAVCLVFSLAACGGGGGGSDTTADNGNGDDPAGGGNGGGNGGDNGGGSGGGNSAPAGPWLCFTALKAGSTVSTTNVYGTVTYTPSIEFSTDGENWEPFDLNTGDDATNTKVTLANAGDKVYLRATETNDSFSADGKCIKFTMKGSIAASGNVMSLLDKTCTSTTIPCDNCFSRLFSGCSALKTAPELPAVDLTNNCYDYMFYWCTDLTTAPRLPAMTLASHCYSRMFYNCSSLTEPPVLPATTLAEYCYNCMFQQCYSLQTAPVLPVKVLKDSCYSGMFYSCTSLTEAPNLPATTLANSCYGSMFGECEKLQTAPVLPAATLVDYCYKNMFSGCSNLNSITVHFMDWDVATDATSHWVRDVADSGEFHCPAGLIDHDPLLDSDFGEDKIPKNSSYKWTVITDVPEPAP